MRYVAEHSRANIIMVENQEQLDKVVRSRTRRWSRSKECCRWRPAGPDWSTWRPWYSGEEARGKGR